MPFDIDTLFIPREGEKGRRKRGKGRRKKRKPTDFFRAIGFFAVFAIFAVK